MFEQPTSVKPLSATVRLSGTPCFSAFRPVNGYLLNKEIGDPETWI
jgi:hypothetical protein